MKEYVAETGGRYTYSDDILNLQELTLSLSAIFDGCSDFIISGCGAGSPLYRFEMTIIPNAEAEGACDNVRKDV